MAGLVHRSDVVRRIAITQRHVPTGAASPARDALDSDWPIWFAEELPRSQFIPVPNFRNGADAVRYVEAWGVDALLLSGGEDTGAGTARDTTEAALLERARAGRWPVLGVCRGMQQLQLATGGTLIDLPDHVGASHGVRIGQQMATVNSWHRRGVMQVAPAWNVLAVAADGSIEAMRHRLRPWLALMWHPERDEEGADAARAWILELMLAVPSPTP